MRSDTDFQDKRTLSDEELMLLAGQNDRRAFDLIMQRYLSKIWRLAFSVLKTEQDADDCVQDVFFKLWQARESWEDNQTAKFSTWIYKMALNKAIDLRRAKIRKNETAQNAAPEQTAKEDTYKLLFRKDLNKRLTKLIQSLPTAQQEVLALHYFQELNVAEISTLLQSSEQSIRSLLKRGRQGMRDKAAFMPDLKHYELSELL